MNNATKQMPGVLGQFLSLLIPITQFRGYKLKSLEEKDGKVISFRVVVIGFRAEWSFKVDLQMTLEDIISVFTDTLKYFPGDTIEAASWEAQLDTLLKTHKLSKTENP